MKQQIKAATIVKLEGALSLIIPYSLNHGVLDTIKSTTLPMYKRPESVVDLEFVVPEDDLEKLFL